MSYAEIVDEKKIARILRREGRKLERQRREVIKQIRKLEKSLVELR